MSETPTTRSNHLPLSTDTATPSAPSAPGAAEGAAELLDALVELVTPILAPSAQQIVVAVRRNQIGAGVFERDNYC